MVVFAWLLSLFFSLRARGHFKTPRIISVTLQKPIVPKLLSKKWPQTREAVEELGNGSITSEIV